MFTIFMAKNTKARGINTGTLSRVRLATPIRAWLDLSGSATAGADGFITFASLLPKMKWIFGLGVHRRMHERGLGKWKKRGLRIRLGFSKKPSLYTRGLKCS
jgi:hypothetical protein